MSSRRSLAEVAPLPAAAPDYELLRGTVRLAYDRGDPSCRAIADFQYAELGASGRVELEADFHVLRPRVASDWNRGLVVHIPNKGKAGLLPLSPLPRQLTGSLPRYHVGDAYLLRQGWAVLAVGWQWDVARADPDVGLTVPHCAGIADSEVAVQFRASESRHDYGLHEAALGGSGRHASAAVYPARTDGRATLVARQSPRDPGITIDSALWAFARHTASGPVPDDKHVWLETQFVEGMFYEVRYQTSEAPLVGGGLLAVRDLVARVRKNEDHLLPGQPYRVLAIGIAQAGRFVRQFLYDRMNTDSEGAGVFDGVLTWSAGGDRGEFNHRHGAPGTVTSLNPCVTSGPWSSAAILGRQREAGNVPRAIFANSSAEYWRGDAGRSHIDCETDRDITDPPEVRHYLLSGVDHYGVLPVARLMNPVYEACETEPTWFQRACFAALDRWVSNGVSPEPSMVPSVERGTAVLRQAALAQYAKDWRVPADSSFHPAHDGDQHCYVPAIDERGAERGGVHMPETDPGCDLGPFAGWNLFAPGGDSLAASPAGLGSCLPRTTRSPGWTHARVREAAEAHAAWLTGKRLLLAEDREAAVRAALTRLDRRLAEMEIQP